MDEPKCPECGYETSVVQVRKKIHKKLTLTENWIRYCKYADCDWEEEIKNTEKPTGYGRE